MSFVYFLWTLCAFSGIGLRGILTIFVMMPTDKTHTSIRRIREEAGLSQAMMADELGIGRTTYINFETGKVNLYCKTLSKFAAYFGLDAEDLVSAGRKDSLLEEKRNFDEQRKALIRDYESRLEVLGEKLKAALQMVQTQDQTIKTLSQTNAFLLSRLKDE